jgi:hypothetical protein
MDAICFSEMSVVFQQIKWHFILEDIILHNHCCENLKSYILTIELLLETLPVTQLVKKFPVIYEF